VAQDFIKVAFENSNGIFTMPIMKIPQAMTQYMRNPTQVGDKGHAVPGSYYLGGVTGDAGGSTNFYPRGNLTTLNFNGISHTDNPSRDYNQLTHMGGPAGWTARAFQKQQNQNQGQQQQSQGLTPQNLQTAQFGRAGAIAVQQKLMAASMGVSISALQMPSVMDSSNPTSGTGSGDQQQEQDETNFGFDKNGLSTIQSGDTKHNITVDKKGKQITLNVPIGEWVYHGGDGKTGKYARVMTENGPSPNVKARIS
jgi:hypothetical protein